MAVAPNAAKVSPIAVRARPGGVVADDAASRIACSGATWLARRAGANAATMVTSAPTPSPTSTVRGASTSPAGGSVLPRSRSSALRPTAAPTPAATPPAAATSPTMAASPSTEPSTWRRVAPSSRSSATSRVRLATSTAKVFQMMNPPTSSATAANTSRTAPSPST